MAAAAGVKLLQVDDLPVPLSVAKSGALGILEGMLDALAKGEVVLANPELPENIGEPPSAPPIAPVESPPAANNGGGEEPPAQE
jgi:hypothetical protein